MAGTAQVLTPAPPVEGHAKCGATTRGTGKPCTRPAGWGTDHVGVGPCKLHLGCTQNHRTAARKMLAERGAAQTLAEFGYEPVTDPIGTLADLAGQTRALVALLAAKVDAFGEGWRYSTEGGSEQLRAEVALYERMLDRTARFVTDLAKLGFEERRTAMAEEDSRRFVDALVLVMDGVLAALEGRKVTAAVAASVRRDALPGLVQQAIETTGRAA